MKNTFKKYKFVFIPFVVAAFAGLIGFTVMQLWNHLLPDILGVKMITFWQALGLFVLCKILFGFGKGGPGRGAPWMRNRMDRFKNMSDEERELFKKRMRDRCGWKRNERDNDWEMPGAENPGQPS